MLSEVLPGGVTPAIVAFQSWDAANRQGVGASDATASGVLAWDESTFLRNYMLCYFVSRDTYWLDKMVDHFDRMVANLKDLKGDGFLTWSDKTYSLGIARTEAVGDVGEVKLEPSLRRVWTDPQLVTGHEYSIEFISDAEFLVRDVTVGEAFASRPYSETAVIEEVPGVALTLRGQGKQGARFWVTTIAQEELAYQVHDGMVTYPVAQFIEIVFADPTLEGHYRAKAEQYAELLYRHFFEKWETTWLDLPDGLGVYRFTNDPTQRHPGASLPHNQYLALARTWLVLQAVPGLDHREEYRDRATKMALRFRSNLRSVGSAYSWNYWDPLPAETITVRPEDLAHSTIDISFVIEAAAKGIVFSDNDLRHFAATYSDLMWNGSLSNPLLGDSVATNEGATSTSWEWIQLGRVSERVSDIGSAVYRAHGTPPYMQPQMAYLYADVVGVTEADRASCAEATQRLLGDAP